MTKKRDCPVSDALCLARMDALKTEIEGIKNTIKVSAAILGIVLTVLEIVLKVL